MVAITTISDRMATQKQRELTEQIEKIYKRAEKANRQGDHDAERQALVELETLRQKCPHANQYSYQSHAPSMVTVCQDCDVIVDEIT